MRASYRWLFRDSIGGQVVPLRGTVRACRRRDERHAGYARVVIGLVPPDLIEPADRAVLVGEVHLDGFAAVVGPLVPRKGRLGIARRADRHRDEVKALVLIRDVGPLLEVGVGAVAPGI